MDIKEFQRIFSGEFPILCMICNQKSTRWVVYDVYDETCICFHCATLIHQQKIFVHWEAELRYDVKEKFASEVNCLPQGQAGSECVNTQAHTS